MPYRRWIVPVIVALVGGIDMALSGFNLAFLITMIIAVVFYGWVWPKRPSARA